MTATVPIALTVNGDAVTADVDPRLLLVDLLRDHLGLTGTHVGCETSQCGACVVHLDGQSVKACSHFAVQAHGTAVTTIEGIADGDELHPVQAAFREHHGLQCGFCTPGLVMSVLDFASRDPEDSDPAIRTWLKGNLCRCTGYQNIVAAVRASLAARRSPELS